MPIFEFRCKSCDHQFESLVRSTDASMPCPSCRSEQVTRLFSTFASRSAGGGEKVAAAPRPTGGGGCGPSCGCH